MPGIRGSAIVAMFLLSEFHLNLQVQFGFDVPIAAKLRATPSSHEL